MSLGASHYDLRLKWIEKAPKHAHSKCGTATCSSCWCRA